MKSIKEKAQEWADMYPSCGMADKSFKAGADYVLGEILDKTSKCINIKDAYEVFLECVEQLKK